ncbi:MAG: ATP-dependent helicase HrpB [Deltaproteobacteria bacterium]|nr:ATP-dependent helicase HrpB [Deltaproteobacteria bacterium]
MSPASRASTRGGHNTNITSPPPKRLVLPVDAVLDGLIADLTRRPNAVVVAPPGSGKTTRVPPALLDAGLAGSGSVVVLQPRRVAARLSAKRIAEERGVRLGGEVGYRTRFERKVGPDTRIEFMTEGLLLRRLQTDPFIEDIGVVVLDELHERSLDLDLALALLREVQMAGRDDLHLIAMSATLDPGPVMEFLGGDEGCSLVTAEGRAFPVELEWLARASERRVEEQVASAVRRMLAAEPSGHLLVFMPSVATIGRTLDALKREGLPAGVTVLPLHGSLPPREQDEALAPSRKRKVVLATNVAETSVTFDGVRVVIDSGLAVVPRFDSSSGTTRLQRERIARDSADQRAGRAGRTGPGRCLRLWTEAEDHQLAAASTPAVRRSDLTSAALQLFAWGVAPRDFGWFERPPEGALTQALDLLETLGATSNESLSPVGRQLANLPVHPRSGRVLLAAKTLNVLASAATAAALSEGRDIARRHQRGEPDDDDLSMRLRMVAHAGRGRRGGSMAEVLRVRDQLLRLAERADAGSERREDLPGSSETPALVRALLAGYPDRVGLRRSATGDRYRLASGGGARLSEESACRGEEYILALSLDGGRKAARSESWIRIAVALQPQWLEAKEEEELVFDVSKEAVVSRRIRRFGALVLSERPGTRPRDPLAQAVLLEEAAREADLEVLLKVDRDAETLLGRIDTVRRLRPELELPDLGDLSLLLPALCVDRRSFADLRKAPLGPAILATLSWSQRQAVNTEAPERMRVPSGSTVRLVYSRDGSPPVLAARIQQLFGMLETPRVAGGRLPVLVHLLAPNGRPAQVTQDLASFWTNTWPEVRKDLRGRYPRHSWPEDPTTAKAVDRPRRRR